MTGHRASSGIVATMVFLLSSAAQAQTLEPTTVSAELGDASRMRLGLVLSPMPTGTFKGAAGSTDTDAKFAFALMPTFDLGLSQFFFIGLAPQFIFNVQPTPTGEAGQELDLRVRLGGIAKVADTIRLFGYAAPGYSFIMVPKKAAGQENPTGLVVGFAAGAAFDLSPAMYLSAELGYQVGYQAANSVDFKSNYLHVGLGLGVRL
jgi:hypothetical protein